MIDTIRLLIPKEKLTMLDLEASGVKGWSLHSKTDQYDKYVKNPSKRDKEKGLYFPRLTGYRRMEFAQNANVCIEFSVPKLLFMNNLDELEGHEFSDIVETLQKRLKMMGVSVEKAILQSASVSMVHFSKNIPLENGYTSSHLISEISKVDLRKSFDFAKTRFINDGQSLYAHTTSHQFVIYDKISDMSKGQKRAIDKDQTLYQQNLFSQMVKDSSYKEIIRFEIRLSSKQKMNSVLGRLGYSKNPTFREIFSLKMSQDVVRSYWKNVISDRNSGVFSVPVTMKDTLRSLLSSVQGIKAKQAIYMFGLITLSRDDGGMRQLRELLSKSTHSRTWYRIAQDIKSANETVSNGEVRDWVRQIDISLDRYKPYKHDLSTH